MRAGDLRDRVTIQRIARIENEFGEQDVSWITLCDVWADIRPLNARETVRAKQAQLDHTHTVVIRYFPGLTSDDRLVYSTPCGSNRILNIEAIVNVGNLNKDFELTCREVASG